MEPLSDSGAARQPHPFGAGAEHVRGWVTQAPATQLPAVEQAFPSLQAWPSGSGEQTPSTPAPAAMEHATQSVLWPAPHAESQQTPSAQNPLAQSDDVEQTVPFVAKWMKRRWTDLLANVPASVS